MGSKLEIRQLFELFNTQKLLSYHVEDAKGALFFIERTRSLDAVNADVAALVVPYGLTLGVGNFVSR